jgi:hypothetical protein
MAQFIPTKKLNSDDPEFCFEAGGYALMRIVCHEGNYALMTATASEDIFYTPYQSDHDRNGSSIFRTLDDSPLFAPKPPPKPLLAKAFPDADKLISAAEEALKNMRRPVENAVDSWGRRYVKVFGPFEDSDVRRACNQVARTLGLETADQPWTGKEEGQLLYEDLRIDDSGNDVVLDGGTTLSADGTYHHKG